MTARGPRSERLRLPTPGALFLLTLWTQGASWEGLLGRGKVHIGALAAGHLRTCKPIEVARGEEENGEVEEGGVEVMEGEAGEAGGGGRASLRWCHGLHTVLTRRHRVTAKGSRACWLC